MSSLRCRIFGHSLVEKTKTAPNGDVLVKFVCGRCDGVAYSAMVVEVLTDE